MGKLASTTVYTWCWICLNPSSRIKLVEGLAEILLAHRAVFIALLDSSSELSWVGTSLIILKTWSWSPYSAVFGFSNTVLLGVGNCLIFLLGSSAESFNSSIVVWYEIESLSDLSLLSGFSRLIAWIVSSNVSLSR